MPVAAYILHELFYGVPCKWHTGCCSYHCRAVLPAVVVLPAGGTLVAIPNKTVAELIVYNRTRSLAAAAAANAAAADSPETAAAAIASVAVPAPAAPLRRVLCFSIQLGRDCDQRLDEVRGDVKAVLNRITVQQLVDCGLAVYSAEQMEQQASAAEAKSRGRAGAIAAAAVEPAAVAPAAAPAGAADDDASEQQDQQEQRDAASSPVGEVIKTVLAGITGSVDTAGNDASADSVEQQQQLPEAEPLPVSISLAQLAEGSLKLFVRCELMLPGSTAEDAVEQQTEEVLIAVSGLVKEKYQGTVLWC
jgi:hypothetical protein